MDKHISGVKQQDSQIQQYYNEDEILEDQEQEDS